MYIYILLYTFLHCFDHSLERRILKHSLVSPFIVDVHLNPIIHQVVLAGFAVDPPKTEQSDAQNSVFRNSTGL
jgi:hypothetical protein